MEISSNLKKFQRNFMLAIRLFLHFPKPLKAFFCHKIQIKVASFSFMFVLEMEGMNKKKQSKILPLNEFFFVPNNFTFSQFG